jgi:cell division protein ZapA
LKNKETVEIYGCQYAVCGQASSGQMQQIAGYVDRKMRELASNNPCLDTARLAMLSAVNIADDYLRLQADYQELEELVNA